MDLDLRLNILYIYIFMIVFGCGGSRLGAVRGVEVVELCPSRPWPALLALASILSYNYVYNLPDTILIFLSVCDFGEALGHFFSMVGFFALVSDSLLLLESSFPNVLSFFFFLEYT